MDLTGLCFRDVDCDMKSYGRLMWTWQQMCELHNKEFLHQMNNYQLLNK